MTPEDRKQAELAIHFSDKVEALLEKEFSEMSQRARTASVLLCLAKRVVKQRTDPEGIITGLKQSIGYFLMEEYRSNPEAFLAESKE